MTARRPSSTKIVADQLGLRSEDFTLEQRLAGIRNAYNARPSFETAVYFALETIAEIGNDNRRKFANVPLKKSDDPQWGFDPLEPVEIPRMWIEALTEAWHRYQTSDLKLGHAFGLEAPQKPPLKKRLALFKERAAIALWIEHTHKTRREAGKKISLADVQREAADKFGRSFDTIRAHCWGQHHTRAKAVIAARKGIKTDRQD